MAGRRPRVARSIWGSSMKLARVRAGAGAAGCESPGELSLPAPPILGRRTRPPRPARAPGISSSDEWG